MNIEQIIQTIILAIFGFLVLVSYYFFLEDKNSKNYLTSKYWYGLNPTIINILVVFQVFALIGFLTAVISWLIDSPKGGTFATSSWIFFTIVLIFFIFSALWSYAVSKNDKILTILSLIIVAICSILMLAMSVEETEPRWFITLGLIFLCITTVLGDAIIWNANYIVKSSYISI